MADDVDLQHHKFVSLTDLGSAIVQNILPRVSRRHGHLRLQTTTSEEREKERKLEIERAIFQPGHWRNKEVKFIRPDGRIETKSVGWCEDNGFSQIKNGRHRGCWAGNWITTKAAPGKDQSTGDRTRWTRFQYFSRTKDRHHAFENGDARDT